MEEMTCRDKILSNDFTDWIIDFPFTDDLRRLVGPEYEHCYDMIDDNWGVVHVRRDQIPDISRLTSDYRYLPDLYGLQQITAPVGQGGNEFNASPLLNSGMILIQQEPLNLTGRGIILAFADTGIDYRNPVFLHPDGTTRILAIWDQTLQEGNPPEGFLYGTEYRREQINEALNADNPLSIVPSTDEIGHGTRMASIAAGSMPGDQTSFRSPAYEADIVVVKMKQCKQYLRDYYLIPDEVVAYQSNDIMMAIKYLDSFARAFERPVVFCLGVGTNYGDHIGSAILARYLANVAERRSRVMLLAGGNEGNAAHHFSGRIEGGEEAFSNGTDMEIRVGEGENGFILEIWVSAPTTVSISIKTPGGEMVPRNVVLFQRNLEYSFVYERTIITVDYALVETSSGDELILVRFQNPTPGIWTLIVTGDTQIMNTTFNAWLPLTQFLSGNTYFLRPDPDLTLTIPSYSESSITTSTYDSYTNSFYVNSGRGFSRAGTVKPDFATPGVGLSSTYNYLRGNPVVQSVTGSSYAAALAAGGIAQFMQWAVINRNAPYVRSTEVKNYLIRGAVREPQTNYPNRQWGFGKLNIGNIFDTLSGR